MGNHPILSRLCWRLSQAFAEAAIACDGEVIDFPLPSKRPPSMADEVEAMRLERDVELAGVCCTGNVDAQSKVAPISTPYRRKRERMLRAIDPTGGNAA